MYVVLQMFRVCINTAIREEVITYISSPYDGTSTVYSEADPYHKTQIEAYNYVV